MFQPLNSRIIMRDAFDDISDNGAIFTYLVDPPWSTIEVESPLTLAELLDVDYVIGHSGAKLISPLVHGFIDDDGLVKLSGRTFLANLVMAKYYPIWTKLWDTYSIEYDPLNNYSIEESGGANEIGNTSNTLQYGGSQSRGINSSGTLNVSRYGFNSATAVPTDINASTDGTTENTTNSGSDTNTGSNSKSTSYTRSKSGFNGLSSYQELIRKDRELWVVDYFKQIYDDLDKVFTIPIYPAEAVLHNPYWIPSYPII